MTREELAARAGVTSSSIRAIEDGRTLEPGIFTVAALAVALDLDVTDLLRNRTGPIRVRQMQNQEVSRAGG